MVGRKVAVTIDEDVLQDLGGWVSAGDFRA